MEFRTVEGPVRRLLLPTLALLAILAVAACGGTGSATPSPTQGTASQPPTSEAPAASEPAAAGPCDGSTEAPDVEATMADFAFSPDPVQASVGDVIGWTNEDSAPHSVVVGSDCRTGNLQQGMTGALVFTEPGTYDYVCGIHPNMTATIEVGE
jgi:plastocyanin